MLTIQCTILPRLIEFKDFFSSFEMSVLFSVYLISLIFYFIAILFFIFTLINLDEIQTAPRIDALIELQFENKSNYIVDNTLISLNTCVEVNDEILNIKNVRGNIGLILMKLGIIFTTIFIIYFILIIN